MRAAQGPNAEGWKDPQIPKCGAEYSTPVFVLNFRGLSGTGWRTATRLTNAGTLGRLEMTARWSTRRGTVRWVPRGCSVPRTGQTLPLPTHHLKVKKEGMSRFLRTKPKKGFYNETRLIDVAWNGTGQKHDPVVMH